MGTSGKGHRVCVFRWLQSALQTLQMNARMHSASCMDFLKGGVA